MTRRLLIPVWVLAAALTATSCATFENTRRVAGVNGRELSEETLADMLESPLGIQVLQTSPVDGLVAGDAARGLIAAWIALTAIDSEGVVDEAARATATEEVDAQFGDDWDSAPEELRNLLVLNGAVNSLLQSGGVSQDGVQQTIEGADVTVSPRYGRWEPDGGGVVPLG